MAWGAGAPELRGVYESKVALDSYAGKGAGDVGNYIFSFDFELIIHTDKRGGSGDLRLICGRWTQMILLMSPWL